MSQWRRLGSVLKGENAVIIGLLLGVGLLLTPLPGAVLDGLLAINLGLGLALLLIVMWVERPSLLSGLPSWLVLSSLTRIFLALGVARAALTGGSAGTLVAMLGGQLTGQGENLLGGLALFAMLAIVAYTVIGMGVMRLAEVAARFALDALPGRQMAIDSALTAGRLEVESGLAQTRQLQADSSFYGGMDGVARFLRGDAIACMLVCALLPVAAASGGGAGGVSEYLTQAVGLAALLLLSAILAGSAAALALSRSAAGVEEKTLLSEVLHRPALPVGVAIVLLALALAPGIAKIPLVGVAVIALGGAWYAHRQRKQTRLAAEQQAGPQLELRLGLGLISLLAGQELRALLSTTRAQLADELGFAVPPFEVADDAALPANDFSLSLGGAPTVQATLRLGRRLLVAADEGVLPGGGLETELPGGLQATWLRAEDDLHLPAEQYRLLDPLQVLALYLQGTLRTHAEALFDLQRATEWLAAVQATHPASVAALERTGRGVAEVRLVGRALLREGVPLRERVSVVEAVGAAAGGLAAGELVEAVRPALARTLTQMVAPDGVAEVIAMAPALEAQLLAAEWLAPGEPATLPPEQAERWTEVLLWLGRQYGRPQQPAVLLCQPQARPVAAQLIVDCGARVRAIVARELQPLTRLQTIHTVSSLDAEGTLVVEAREGLN